MAPKKTKTEETKKSFEHKLITIFSIVLVLIILIVAGLFFKDTFINQESTNKADPYQGIFLTNGQVYFGQIQEEGKQYLTLGDIYYLQVNNQLQAQDGAQPKQNDLKLVKFGSELHGPKDAMRINLQQILFIEDLREDSEVVKAIENYNEEKE